MRFLGTIAAAAGASTTNASTASPFEMPASPCSLFVVPAATGLCVATKAVAAATDFPLGTPSWTFPWAGRQTGLLAAWNTTGAPINLKVYASDGPGFVLSISP